MENTGTCSFERRLCKIRSSLTSPQDFCYIICFLKILISDLVNHPLDGQYKVIRKNQHIPLYDFMACEDIQGLFILLGYHEEEEKFVHNLKDEHIKILEGCLGLLEYSEEETRKESQSEFSDRHISHTEESMIQKLCDKKQKSEALEESKGQDNSFSGKLKQFFEKKHQKKECSSFFSFLKCEPKTNNAPEISFNSNGYFHQACNKRGKSNQSGFIQDVYHPQATSNKKKWGFC